MKRIFAIISVLVLMGAQALAKDGALDRKIDRIVASLTLEEKASLLVGVWEEGGPSNIISSAGRTHGVERLGIGMTTMNDGPTGLRMDTLRKGFPDERYYCTGFPSACLLAATWNDEIVSRVGACIGDEMNAYGCDLLLAPSLNIQRNPLCGRNFEYYSEDPYLAGHTAARMVSGMQSKGVGATIKHFAANSQQTARVANDARVSERALREIYLRNFEIAVCEGDPVAVMSSLNWVNGTRTAASEPLLTGVLRDEWGWDGVVMTDWFDPENTGACLHAGNDLFMGGNPRQVEDIIKGVKDGGIAMSDVDRNVRNVLRYILRTPSHAGLEPTYAPDLKADAEVALEAAREGIVLLKNEGGALPLAGGGPVAVFGVGSYIWYANGTGSADVNKPYVVTLMDGLEAAGINVHPTVDEYYRRYLAAEQVQLRETNTNTWRNWFFGFKRPAEARPNSWFLDLRAGDCDAAVITLSRNAGESLDRDFVQGDFLLTDDEQSLIDAVCEAFHAKGKKVIVVLNMGSQIDVRPFKDKADAIVLAWQPGQEGGRAVADVLKGDVNPSGKLPSTWAPSYEDYPSSANFPTHYEFSWEDVKPYAPASTRHTRNLGYTLYEEGIWVGYRWFNTYGKDVVWPFGHGLSYTTFEWSDARIISRDSEGVNLAVTVANTGPVPGKDVVQLYSTAPKTEGFDTPLRELRAYAKTSLLEPGCSEEVRLRVKWADLASFHEDSHSWISPAGTYRLSLASSVEDVRSELEVRLKKKLERPVKAVLAAPAEPKPTAVVLGDSYSTFAKQIPEGYKCWYFTSPKEDNDVCEVRQTWWCQLCDSLGVDLVLNSSYSGSTVCNTGYHGADATESSFVTRVSECIELQPDILFIFGGTNDSWAKSPVGSLKYSDWSEGDLKCFLPAFCRMLDRIKTEAPGTKVVNIVNSDLSPEITEGQAEACRHYGVTCVMLHDIGKGHGHPNSAGMKAICSQVLDCVSAMK